MLVCFSSIFFRCCCSFLSYKMRDTLMSLTKIGAYLLYCLLMDDRWIDPFLFCEFVILIRRCGKVAQRASGESGPGAFHRRQSLSNCVSRSVETSWKDGHFHPWNWSHKGTIRTSFFLNINNNNIDQIITLYLLSVLFYKYHYFLYVCVYTRLPSCNNSLQDC